ncbi:MAG TPA: hypothetical protein VNL92_03035, partial [Dehalococcoidia bacterium]|nr:hypothetical protein [Dehalococcoidia bacterium]
ASLVGDASAEDTRAELSAHIDELAREAMLTGADPSTAYADALRAMGEPRLLARALREARELPPLRPAPAGYTQARLRTREAWQRRAMVWLVLGALMLQLNVLAFLYLYP